MMNLNPGTTIDIDKVRRLLQPCIDRLAPREHEYLLTRHRWLVYDDEPEELTLEEVAEKLSVEQNRSIERGAIARLLHSARTKLKKCLEERDFPNVEAVMPEVIEEAA